MEPPFQAETDPERSQVTVLRIIPLRRHAWTADLNPRGPLLVFVSWPSPLGQKATVDRARIFEASWTFIPSLIPMKFPLWFEEGIGR